MSSPQSKIYKNIAYPPISAPTSVGAPPSSNAHLQKISYREVEAATTIAAMKKERGKQVLSLEHCANCVGASPKCVGASTSSTRRLLGLKSIPFALKSIPHVLEGIPFPLEAMAFGLGILEEGVPRSGG
jgi:hypothetical protein